MKCQYGCNRPAVELRKEYYRAIDGGIICEANLVCKECADKARELDEKLEEAGVLR